jgi:hypothetical protein
MGEERMVMIRCPMTGQSVPTGYGMDEETFKTWRFLDMTVRECPACGADHPWTKEQAWLREEP